MHTNSYSWIIINYYAADLNAGPAFNGKQQGWFAASNYRLYFMIDPPDVTPASKTKVTSAVLRFHRKPVTRSNLHNSRSFFVKPQLNFS